MHSGRKLAPTRHSTYFGNKYIYLSVGQQLERTSTFNGSILQHCVCRQVGVFLHKYPLITGVGEPDVVHSIHELGNAGPRWPTRLTVAIKDVDAYK